MKKSHSTSFGTYSSIVVERCQVCKSSDLLQFLFLGYMPPVNQLHTIGSAPKEQPSYPAAVLYCKQCYLVQLGLVVDPQVLFPKEYPYTSSTTRILRENFSELYQECSKMLNLKPNDLIIDIGSNDGNLLSNFKDGHKVLGITPEEIGKIAIERGIPTILDYFTTSVAQQIKESYGQAKVITATNVFAHIENPNEVVKNILKILRKDGVFISESHYLYSLLKTLQYDTIYHEHLRYYSLHSLKYLLELNGLEIFFAKPIPTHGGSIRVYAARKGHYLVNKNVKGLLIKEKPSAISIKNLRAFAEKVMFSKLELYSLLHKIKKSGKKIYAISAPSRASTLVNYVGLDNEIVDCVLEIPGSYKIGKYLPGTTIPIVVENLLFKDQPDYALIFSWHIANELIPKLKEKGFKGKFIIPLPKPKIVT